MKHSVTKIDIALVQLRTSIQLYNKNNFIASITLAGAAEEILGKVTEKQSGVNSLLEDKLWLDQIADWLNKPRSSLKNIAKSRNRLKNELKHNDAGENVVINEDFRFEAETHIINSIRNYELITGEIPKDRVIRRFWNWISL